MSTSHPDEPSPAEPRRDHDEDEAESPRTGPDPAAEADGDEPGDTPEHLPRLPAFTLAVAAIVCASLLAGAFCMALFVVAHGDKAAVVGVAAVFFVLLAWGLLHELRARPVWPLLLVVLHS